MVISWGDAQTRPGPKLGAGPHFGKNKGIYGIYGRSGFSGFSWKILMFFNFWGVPVVQEGSGEVPGASTLHPD